MDWNKITIPNNAQVMQIHTFSCVMSGLNYSIEIDQYANDRYIGHAEQSNDASNSIEPVQKENLEDCLNDVLAKLSSKT